MVTVAPNATFTDAKQSNRNLLASPDARMHARPQLIINCDEVKASHGSATGQLDQNALFYMRSRGIPEAEARMMLVNAFMIDVLDAISLEPLRERLRHLVDRRLRGCESLCHGCEISQSHA
jgi:Fe-S cluster assembly protein SufD